jgi:hypothetical protein
MSAILPAVYRFENGASIEFLQFALCQLQQSLANRGLPSYLTFVNSGMWFSTSALICSFTREESVAIN